jgi:hypothetical protein
MSTSISPGMTLIRWPPRIMVGTAVLRVVARSRSSSSSLRGSFESSFQETDSAPRMPSICAAMSPPSVSAIVVSIWRTGSVKTVSPCHACSRAIASPSSLIAVTSSGTDAWPGLPVTVMRRWVEPFSPAWQG